MYITEEAAWKIILDLIKKQLIPLNLFLYESVHLSEENWDDKIVTQKAILLISC